MDGDSLTEIARSMDVPVGTLRVRFDRATRRLRGRDSAVRQARLAGPD
jgi:DNA-directed RNA polymerase specialized sigma24 family protein